MEVFPNLVVHSKWHTEQRNLKHGDVVLVQDSNLVRGEWKMALVIKSNISQDGKVRSVRLAYCTANGHNEEIERPVQRLILLAENNDASGAGECSAHQLLSLQKRKNTEYHYFDLP